MRELCERCGQHPKAINYKKSDRIYYRRLCDSCLIKKRKDIKPWQQEGYKKKFKCESCGFVPRFPEQLTACKHANAWRTICLNCEVDYKNTGKIEIRKDLKSDF